LLVGIVVPSYDDGKVTFTVTAREIQDDLTPVPLDDNELPIEFDRVCGSMWYLWGQVADYAWKQAERNRPWVEGDTIISQGWGRRPDTYYTVTAVKGDWVTLQPKVEGAALRRKVGASNGQPWVRLLEGSGFREEKPDWATKDDYVWEQTEARSR
jgi:hypothetical protein